MGKSASPCYECPDRFLGCHDYCAKYQAYCVKNEELKRLRHKDGIYQSLLYDGTMRVSKGLGRRLSKIR